jgi:hypothetical protein
MESRVLERTGKEAMENMSIRSFIAASLISLFLWFLIFKLVGVLF